MKKRREEREEELMLLEEQRDERLFFASKMFRTHYAFDKNAECNATSKLTCLFFFSCRILSSSL